MKRRTFLWGAASMPAITAASRVTGFLTPALAQQKDSLPGPARGEPSRSRHVSRSWSRQV